MPAGDKPTLGTDRYRISLCRGQSGGQTRVEHGKRVQCGSWYHILTALTVSFEIVDEFLGSAPVSALKVILDNYAVQAVSQNP
jgi:hypothetical protein